VSRASESRELITRTPEQIRERVRQIIEEGGPDRLVVTTTGAPLEANYRALIERRSSTEGAELTISGSVRGA